MKKIFFTGAIALSCMAAYAQFSYDYLRAADDYYKKADYFSAAQYYEKYLGNGNKSVVHTASYNPYTAATAPKKKQVPVSSQQQAIYRLAESYRQLNFPAKAETYYKQTLDFDQSQFPLARYHYATTLRSLGKYEEAEKEFNFFLDDYKTDDVYSTAARKEILSLRFIQAELQRKDVKYYTVSKAPETINTKGANYAPGFLNGNTLLFTSTRPDSSAAKNNVHINRIYQTSYTGTTTGEVTRIDLPQAKDVHYGTVSVTPDGNTLFLTRWTVMNGKKLAALCRSTKSEKGWSEPVALDSMINLPGYSTQQPFVLPNGKYILFSSDRPGGLGGLDLWYAELDENGKPVRTENLGSNVNTMYDEQAPYYHDASTTLVFSSNGRVGMGGFDFFYCTGGWNNWSAPVNFGNPVNSVKDDIYFTSLGSAKNILENVVFSSDRSAECCLELFTLQKIKPLKKISGVVVACDDNAPLAGASVQIIDTVNNKVVYSKTTDADGSYSFTLEEFQPLKATAASVGYTPGNLVFNEPADEDAEALNNPVICLSKIKVEEPTVLNNVYYEFNKAELTEESHPALDQLAALLIRNPSMTIELSAHTDNLGTDKYNQKLSEARAKSCMDYLAGKGIDKSRLTIKGYGASQPLAANQNPDGTDNPDGRKQNRRTEFKIITRE